MKYQDRFLVVLEQDVAPAGNVAPAADTGSVANTPEGDVAEREAMAKSLDSGVKPEDYDVPVPQSTVSDELKRKQISELKTWIATIDNFIEFLNAPNAQSLQSKLHAAGCDTLFDDIARSEKKKISRLAAELSSLSESMKGYLISSNA